MKGGYVECNIAVILMIGVAGAGKTTFLQLVLNRPANKVRKSTRLVDRIIRTVSVSREECSIRAVSISRAVSKECTESQDESNEQTEWEEITPNEILEMVGNSITDKDAIPMDKDANPMDKDILINSETAIPMDNNTTLTDKAIIPMDKHIIPTDKDVTPTDRDTVLTDKGAIPMDKEAVPKTQSTESSPPKALHTYQSTDLPQSSLDESTSAISNSNTSSSCY